MTLLETLVWIAIFVMAMLAIMSTILYFYRTNAYTIQQATAVAQAQHGMDQLVRTIREAAYSSVGAYPIVSMNTNDLVFYANIDSDPYIEKVHYYLSGTSLYRGIVEPSGDPAQYTGSESVSDVADYIHNLDNNVATFTYYDKNGAQITDLSKVADVRFISINLNIDVDPSKSPTVLIIKSSTALRNLIN